MLPCARQAVLMIVVGGIGNRFKLSGTDNVACVFVFHSLSTVQINLFRTSPSYTASEGQCFRFGI